MLPRMPTGPADKPVVIAAILERRHHLQVRQPPVAPLVVEIALAILQIDAQRPGCLFANRGGVDMPAANIRKGSEVRHHFPEGVRPLPGDREGTNTTGGRATDRTLVGVGGQIPMRANLWEDLV